MKNKVAALSLALILTAGLVYTHPAYAHNFGGDESSQFLGKVANLKAELQALQMDLSNSDAVSWHVDKIGEYWNDNDTKEMGERNQLLAKEIPDSLNSVLTDAQKSNPDASTIKQDIDTLNGYLDEGITVRIDKNQMQNATVQALAVTDIIGEALESYGDAINSTVDLNNMSQLQGMSSTNVGSNMSGMKMGTSYSQDTGVPIHLVQMSGMQSGGENIVEIAAYHSAQIHAQAAKDYFDKNVVPIAPSGTSAFVTKADDNLAKLIDEINNKADPQTVMTTVHLNIHPALISAFNLPLMTMNTGANAVPEFPMPVLLALVSIIGVVVITRFRANLK